MKVMDERRERGVLAMAQPVDKYRTTGFETQYYVLHISPVMACV